MTERKSNLSAEEELKQLLLGDERLQIDQISSRLKEVSATLAAPDEFAPLVSNVLNQAMQNQDKDERARLVVTLSGLIANPVKREIRNAQPEIMQALYPVADSLVAQGVKNAMAKLQSGMNQRMKEKLSPLYALKLQARALLSGKSKAALLLQDNPPYAVEDLILIDRSSGLVVGGAFAGTDEEKTDEDQLNAEIAQERLAGLLSALEVFAKDALSTPNSENSAGELRRLQTDQAEIFVDSSPAFTFAARVTGQPPTTLDYHFEAAFKEIQASWAGLIAMNQNGLDLADQTQLEEDLSEALVELGAPGTSPPMSKTKRNLMLGALAAVCLGLFVWVGHSVWQNSRLANIQTSFQSSEQLQPYVLAVERKNGRVHVRGLVRFESDKQAVREILIKAVGPSAYDMDLAVLETQP